MTRTRWLVLGVLAIVVVTAVVLSQHGPARIAVDTVRATRQSRFVSTVNRVGRDRGDTVRRHRVERHGNDRRLLAVPPLWSVAAGLAVSVGVGVAAGYWPAQRAAGLDPVEALRHE